MPNPPCTGVLMIAGQFYACDWDTDERGAHDGWAHASRKAQAIWADDPTVVSMVDSDRDRMGHAPVTAGTKESHAD